MMKHLPAIFGTLALILFLDSGTGVFAQGDIEGHRACARCGMDRKAYGFSRMLIRYSDGTTVGVCSLRCAAVELEANAGREVQVLLVADRNDRNLIDAGKAVWVLGGRKRGVMTDRPKWAFGSITAAEAFINDQGGTIVPWNEVLAAAREDHARESR